MEWIEVSTLPLVCQECKELDCWECDNAGERWILSPEDELLVRRKALQKPVERLQKQIAEIDRQLSSISAGPVISKNTEKETEV